MTLGENFRAAFSPGAIEFGQPKHLKRARPVGQPADEAALLQRRDQPVDAGFRREIQRILHFVEGRGDAGLLQPLMNEEEKFMLLARQHRSFPRESNVKQNQNKHYLFQLCSATV